MYQWQDDTLVAIRQADNGKFKVIELPARQVKVYSSKKSFRLYEQAEDYIAAQYPTGLRVGYEDIAEEVATRKAWLQRQEQTEREEA